MVKFLSILSLFLVTQVYAASWTSLGATVNTNAGDKTVTATPAVGDLIVVIAGASGTNASNAATTNVSDNQSGTYTMIQECDTSSSPRMSIWVRTTLVSSATSTIYTASQGSSNGGGLEVFSLSSMKKTGSTARRQSAAGTGNTGTTPSVALSVAILTGNPVIGGCMNANSPATLTQTTSWSESQDTGYSSPTAGFETEFRNSGETASTINWGSTSTGGHKEVVAEFDISNNSLFLDWQ